MPKKSGLPPNVTEFKDRHGSWHLRFRRKGQPTFYFTALPGTDEFREQYRACLDAKPLKRSAFSDKRIKPGSISALIAIYYSAPEYTGLADSTKATYRGILERFRVEYGELPAAGLDRASVKAIIGGMSDKPSAANNLLDRLRALMVFAMDAGWRKDDPTHRVKGFKINGEGFHTWTEAEIEKFLKKHKAGSKPRLAMALMLYLGQRRSDAVRMGRQHVDGGRIRVFQQKTKAMLSIPMHPTLVTELSSLSSRSRDEKEAPLAFLLTQYGKPFSAAGFGNWFRRQCDLAGLPQCAAHGLRKAAARRLAEAGCTNQQIKAVTGHKTDKEVSRYTAAADQLKLSDQAIAAITVAQKTAKSG